MAFKEPQYQCCLDLVEQEGAQRFGLMSNFTWHSDPKRLLFVLSRYKFAAKMLAGRKRVLEAGCADGFGSRIVRQAVGTLTAVDFDPVFIENARQNQTPRFPIDYRVHDMLSGTVPGGPYDGALSMDVIEHIDPAGEDLFMKNLVGSLDAHACLVLGTPSLESQAHASAESRAGHVNCKSHKELTALLSRHFRHVFLFSMNDEVVHTGFYPMAHYLLALCCEPREGDRGERP